MSEPFLGEIRLVGFNFAPTGWAFCHGQLLPITGNQELYSILGTTYGGDGLSTFALPDMRGRIGVHPTKGVHLGQMTGETEVTLNTHHLPAHNHMMSVSGEPATTGNPDGALLAGTAKKDKPYGRFKKEVHLAGGTVDDAGGADPHDNVQPYITMNYVIALVGLFPSRN